MTAKLQARSLEGKTPEEVKESLSDLGLSWGDDLIDPATALPVVGRTAAQAESEGTLYWVGIDWSNVIPFRIDLHAVFIFDQEQKLKYFNVERRTRIMSSSEWFDFGPQ